MFRWITKTILAQKFSILASASGVAAAFILVIVLDAAFVGESHQIVAYIRNMNSDVWVMQKGVSNMHMASTFVWDWKAKAISDLPEVKKATPILYVNTIVNAGERRLFAYVLGLTPDGQRAGPWSMARGKSHPEKGEIILPEVVSKLGNLEIGDQAQIADKTFKIVGFSNETFSMANSLAFVSFSDLEDLIAISGTFSFILVDAQPGVNSEALAKIIEEKIDKVSAISQEKFIQNDFKIALLMGVEIISFMTIIGSILAALIVAFTSYSQVSRRRRELAIIKALGYKNLNIYMAVVFQSIVITGLALSLALFVSWFLLPALSVISPMVNLDVTPQSLIRISIIAAGVSILSAIVPAYFVARVDPISAFKV